MRRQSLKEAKNVPTFEDPQAFLAAAPEKSALLGLDLGTKTIGIACSDVTRTIATPMETIRRSKFKKDLAALLTIIDERQIGGVVMGLPINMDGTEGPRAQSTRAFVRNVLKEVDLPFIFWDERLSTAAVTRTLLEADSSRAKRAEVVDKMAASYILQGFLDRIADQPSRDD